ncbi:MAG: translational repressor RegA [Flavobacteriaceae bacterium]|jgi:hypothetical protein|nr:translational repressor RegA [Flavobacteriaceae bacterium]
MSDVDSLLEISFGQADDFLKIKETLTRIGVASRKDNKLYQSCHILHKQNKYYLVHFKELFKLDGKPTDISDNDLERRNAIAKLLSDWGLLKVKYELGNLAPMNQIKVISHKDKGNWELIAKYNIGGIK